MGKNKKTERVASYETHKKDPPLLTGGGCLGETAAVHSFLGS